VYCYAAAPTRPGVRSDDELAELAQPLSAFHQGRVVLLGDAAHPMTPNPRPGRVPGARRRRRPVAAGSDTMALLLGKLMPSAALRGLAPIYDWQP
jgi:hypothetical protein